MRQWAEGDEGRADAASKLPDARESWNGASEVAAEIRELVAFPAGPNAVDAVQFVAVALALWTDPAAQR